MKTFISILIILFFAGCSYNSSNEPCKPGYKHGWTNWTNEWKMADDFGLMLQSRYCTNCGVYQSKIFR
jgi:hypothetical protein